VDSVTPDEPRRAPIRWHVATVRDAAPNPDRAHARARRRLRSRVEVLLEAARRVADIEPE